MFRAHIRWLFWKTENLSNLIKNNENNENWPKSDTYIKNMEKWRGLINEQQISINKFEEYNIKTRQIMADIRAWFVNEFNILGKPAKKAWLEKQRELRKLERELKVIQYNLDHPKIELEEYEKQCLLTKIEIGERRIGNCKSELDEAEKAMIDEKKELCKRLSYEREDLEPYLYELKDYFDHEKEELITKCKQYSKWWKKYHDIHPSRHVDMPLAKLRSLIAKWTEHNEGKDPEPNPYEIWVEEKTDDTLTFLWKPIEQVLGKKENGEEIKGVSAALTKNYLFNYYGEWFEVDDYQQVNYQTIAVFCQRSKFYNDYWRINKTQANVILHHSPLSQEEICSCPTSDYYTTKVDFDLSYELSFFAYRIGRPEMKYITTALREEDGLNMIYGGFPQRVTDFQEESDKFTGFWNACKKLLIGAEGVLYLWFSSRKGDSSFFHWTYAIPHTNEQYDKLDSNMKQYFFMFKKIGDYDRQKKISKLDDSKTIEKFLISEGLLDWKMYIIF